MWFLMLFNNFDSWFTSFVNWKWKVSPESFPEKKENIAILNIYYILLLLLSHLIYPVSLLYWSRSHYPIVLCFCLQMIPITILRSSYGIGYCPHFIAKETELCLKIQSVSVVDAGSGHRDPGPYVNAESILPLTSFWNLLRIIEPSLRSLSCYTFQSWWHNLWTVKESTVRFHQPNC